MRKKSSRKEKEKKPKRHKGAHHICPTSRGGTDDWQNFYPESRWSKDYKKKHEAWHTLFVNLKSKEAVLAIRHFTEENGRLNEALFNIEFRVVEVLKDGEISTEVFFEKNSRRHKNKEEAWALLFGELNAHKAIEWIEREFIRKEWLNAPQ